MSPSDDPTPTQPGPVEPPFTPPPPPPPAAARAAPAAAAPAAAPATAGLESSLEKIARELLRQQRTDRRWRVFFRLAWFGLVVAVVWALFTTRVAPTAPTTPHTALVEVRGEIALESDANAESIVAGLKSAFEDQGALAVVLRINSPGGSPVQAGIVYDELRRLKDKHKKKVYAVVEESAASGAYYVAVAADEIYVDKASIVGSIGVLMDGFGFDKVMDKVGVERRLITAGSNKGLLDPFSPLRPEQRAHVQAMIDQIHRQFIDIVKQGRGERLKETPETFSGLFWTGEEAVKMGLADGLGNLDYVAREVIKAEEVIDYTPKENVAERLAKRFGAAIGEGAVRALRQLPSLH